MSQVIRKFFMDFEKEEQWLNEMAAKGLALSEYSWARYVFEPSGPGEYIYRIELLKDNLNAEAAEYLQFMEETGAERVNPSKKSAVYKQWVIFRKKASEGPFTIYSDTASKIKHYQRIHRLWISLAVMELIIGVLNVGLVILNNYSLLSSINFILGILLIVLSIVFLLSSLPVRKKINNLKNENLIRE